MDIVAGNHDRRESAREWQTLARWHTQPLVEAPFVFAHEPDRCIRKAMCSRDTFIRSCVCGGKGGGGRVPVFWQRAHALVLPSFGSFTGGALATPEPGDRLYVAGPERVVPLPRVSIP